MFQAWIVPVVAIAYLLILFAVASYGDNYSRASKNRPRPNIYALSLAIYCTTWTFFGSVGLAASSGLNFLAIYLGPVLFITLGFPLLKRIIQLSKDQRITSVADFMGSRYGKNIKVASVAAIIAVFGTIPYIALQLKAISESVTTLIVFEPGGLSAASTPLFYDTTLLITITLAVFTILFGTRHADATEHQEGLMLAVAMESVIKLIAFVAVGIFVVYFLFSGFEDLFGQAVQLDRFQAVAERGFDLTDFALLTMLSMMAFALLPRQFHVAVVENHSPGELKRARWLFPLYLVCINLFVVPIALGGMVLLGENANADSFVLLLPLSTGNGFMSMLAFIGGLSAGTAMVIVACVALAIMVSNDLVLPIYLRRASSSARPDGRSMERLILNVRRTIILFTLSLAYVYYVASDSQAALASIGLISFVAISQLAPAFFGGLFWKRATSTGAITGMVAGFLVWSYTLLLPTLIPPTHFIMTEGLFGIGALRPHGLFNIETSPINHGMMLSLFVNVVGYIVGSLIEKQTPVERMQAATFVAYNISTPRTSQTELAAVSIAQLQSTVSRYLGEARTSRAFEAHWQTTERPQSDQERIDHKILEFSEQLLASAIGASSSRLVHSLLLKRMDTNSRRDIQLLNEASEAVRHNQDMLHSAFEQIDQGICIFDSELRLVSWNSRFRSLLKLPASVGRAGILIDAIVEKIVEKNSLEDDRINADLISDQLINNRDSWSLVLPSQEKIIEIRSTAMPNGGLVMTWNDITERVIGEQKLQEANETLEKRVEERTSDLVRLNQKLKLATDEADAANKSKTRFLAAAGHDILQPLNAARLYSSALSEKLGDREDKTLVDNVGKSLASVEEILGAVLAISRLDSGKLETHPKTVSLAEVIDQLAVEFQPIAQEKGLKLDLKASDSHVRTDPALFKRLLQNLISNGIKYTRNGTVTLAVSETDKTTKITVADTGIGMSDTELENAFAEFKRFDNGAREAPGLGLGLSIVKRISKLLDIPISMRSTVGQGTVFEIDLEPAEAPSASNDNRKDIANDRRTSLQSLEGISVFCIDNEAAILEGMEALLSQWGCSVSTALSTKKAIAAIEEAGNLPDIIFVDYHLDEGLTGIEGVEEIRRHFKTEIPATLVTADRTADVKAQAIAHGLQILNKPVKPAALRALINQYRQTIEAAE